MSTTNLTATVNNEVMVFENEEFGKVRTVEIDGETWFIGKDIASALGYSNTKDAMASHVDEEDKRIIQRSEITTLENHLPKDIFPINFISAEIPNRGLTAINESGLHSLILSSKLPNAKKFKRWITHEVIPSIRKTGSYSMKVAPQADYELPMNYHDALVQLVKQVEINEELIAENKVLTPKAEYCDTVLNKPDLIPISTIAKDLGMTPQKLNMIMKENGIIYKGKSGTWQPYSAYDWLTKKGYADYRSYMQEKAKPQLQWTEKGRKWILKNIKKWKKQVKNNLK